VKGVDPVKPISPLSPFERAKAMRNRAVFDTLMRKQMAYDMGVQMGALSDDIDAAIQKNIRNVIYISAGVAVGTFVLGFIFGNVTKSCGCSA
jgi:hypothetical protein